MTHYAEYVYTTHRTSRKTTFSAVSPDPLLKYLATSFNHSLPSSDGMRISSFLIPRNCSLCTTLESLSSEKDGTHLHTSASSRGPAPKSANGHTDISIVTTSNKEYRFVTVDSKPEIMSTLCALMVRERRLDSGLRSTASPDSSTSNKNK